MVNNKELISCAATEAAFRSLLQTYGLIKRIMEPYFASFGISGSQWAVLRVLHRAKPEALRLTDIGERLLIRPPSVTGVVGRMQHIGLVACKPSSTDFRAKQVKLTQAGSELVERILEGHKAKINSLLGGLTTSEQDLLRELLDRMSEHMEKIEQYKDESSVN